MNKKTKELLLALFEIVLLLPSIILLLLTAVVFFVNNIIRIPFYYNKNSRKSTLRAWYNDTICTIKQLLHV